MASFAADDGSGVAGKMCGLSVSDGASAAPKGKRGLKALQSELLEAKKAWEGEVKVVKSCARTSAAGMHGKGPWPLVCQRIIPRSAEARAFDVEQLKVKLCIDGKSPSGGCGGDMSLLPVHVEVIEAGLPSQLTDKIEAKVEEKWKSDLVKKGPQGGWLLKRMLKWVEKNYLVLIKLEPSLIEHYIGCDDDGSSMRRFTIVKPEALPAGDDDEENDSTDEEEEARRQEYYRKLMEKREKAAEDAAEKKRIEGERKRAMIESGKIQVFRPKQLSKKEQAELRDAKKKQGKRMAKTGPRARPYEGEGAKERKKGKAKNV